MLFFLDTEFTDFETMDLLSVGLVRADGGARFYFERTDYERAACSGFVQQVVLALFGDPTAARGDDDRLRAALVAWLVTQVGPQGHRPGDTPVIACDFQADARLVHHRLDPEQLRLAGVPIPRFLDCNGLVDGLAFQAAFRDGSGTLRRHHALDDAEALRRAHQAWTGSRTSPLDAPLASWSPDLVKQAPWFAFGVPPMNRQKLWERWRG